MKSIHQVVVLGGGSAGFLSALTLKAMLPELDVMVVHSSALPPIGVGESTTSLLPRFLHGGLGFDQDSFYRAVRPSWKLGIRFQDWGAPGTSHFYYPFDEQVAGRSGTLSKEEAYFCFADEQLFSHYTALMDQAKSPCFPKPDGTCAIDHFYGYHIENRAFIRYLQTQATQRGIQIRDQRVLNVTLNAEGSIHTLELEDDTSVTADLFVDCTGFTSRLLGETLGEPFTDYRDSLFCDTAVTASRERHQGVLPYTNCQTMDHGWSWQIELAEHVSHGYVFSSQFCAIDEAKRELQASHPGIADDLQTVSFRAGRYDRFWVKNVAAVGNAAGFVEPLESTGLHMVAVTARTLGQALVDNDLRVTDSMQLRTNEYIAEMWDDIRDCLALHFAFNRCRDTPFWRHCREHTQLAGARRLVDFYRDNGPSSLGNHLIPRNSIFRYAGYLSILIGQKVPSSYHFEPSAAERQQWLQIRQRVEETASHALTMDDGLRRVVGIG